MIQTTKTINFKLEIKNQFDNWDDMGITADDESAAVVLAELMTDKYGHVYRVVEVTTVIKSETIENMIYCGI